MSRKYNPDNPDKNLHLITDVLIRFGYVDFESVVKDQSAINSRGWFERPSSMLGRDVQVYDEAGQFVVEVKNPELPPNKRKLTAREQITMHLCLAFGVPHYVVETPEQMAEILNRRLK